MQRFEHVNSNLVKVDTMVNFPTELDMRPYMTDFLKGYVQCMADLSLR